MTKIEGNGRKLRHIVSSVIFSNSVHVGHPFVHHLNLSFVVWNVHTVLVNGGHVQYCTVRVHLHEYEHVLCTCFMVMILTAAHHHSLTGCKEVLRC